MLPKVAIITCYKDPDYIRSWTLRFALQNSKKLSVTVIKNKHLGFLRYPEVLIKTIKIKFLNNPDIYLLTFRGYEMLLPLKLISWPKKLIYDEFINPVAWLNEPSKKPWKKLFPLKILTSIYRLLLKSCYAILTDTPANSKFSANLMNVPSAKYFSVPVSTNEKLFRPQPTKVNTNKNFQVFYYASMLPLHGLDILLESCLKLKNKKIEFIIAGGGNQAEFAVNKSIHCGAKIIYKQWIPFNSLPRYINNSNLVLGGPFGKTPQAENVITGKTYQFLSSAAPTVIGMNPAGDKFINQENCLLVDLGSSASLTKAINWAYDNPEKLKYIGREGHKTYEQNYSLQIVTEILNHIIQAQL